MMLTRHSIEARGRGGKGGGSKGGGSNSNPNYPSTTGKPSGGGRATKRSNTVGIRRRCC